MGNSPSCSILLPRSRSLRAAAEREAPRNTHQCGPHNTVDEKYPASPWYTFMYYTTRTLILLVHEVCIRSCRISTINSRDLSKPSLRLCGFLRLLRHGLPSEEASSTLRTKLTITLGHIPNPFLPQYGIWTTQNAEGHLILYEGCLLNRKLSSFEARHRCFLRSTLLFCSNLEAVQWLVHTSPKSPKCQSMEYIWFHYLES